MDVLKIPPNVICYTAAIKSCDDSCDLNTALRILDMMRVNGIKANELTYSCLSSVAARACAGKVALSLFREMQMNGYEANAVSYGGVIYACARGGLWSELAFLLKHMKNIRMAIPETVIIDVVSACRFSYIVEYYNQTLLMYNGRKRCGS